MDRPCALSGETTMFKKLAAVAALGAAALATTVGAAYADTADSAPGANPDSSTSSGAGTVRPANSDAANSDAASSDRPSADAPASDSAASRSEKKASNGCQVSEPLAELTKASSAGFLSSPAKSSKERCK